MQPNTGRPLVTRDGHKMPVSRLQPISTSLIVSSTRLPPILSKLATVHLCIFLNGSDSGLYPPVFMLSFPYLLTLLMFRSPTPFARRVLLFLLLYFVLFWICVCISLARLAIF